MTLSLQSSPSKVEASSSAKFNDFKKAVYKPFIAEIANEIKAKIIIDPVSLERQEKKCILKQED